MDSAAMDPGDSIGGHLLTHQNSPVFYLMMSSRDLPRDFFLHLGLESDPTKGRTMKRTRYSEEQIIGILAEHEAGAKCADLCRKHGMSEGTFYIYGRLSPCKRFEAVSDR